MLIGRQNSHKMRDIPGLVRPVAVPDVQLRDIA
jgi:hypothetical protein